MNVLSEADKTVVEKAIQAVSSLSEISHCNNVKALQSEIPLPKDDATKKKVAAIREKLAEVKALGATGRYQKGLKLAQEIEEMTNSIEYKPIQAESLYWLGYLLERVGEYSKAEKTLVICTRKAAESRDALLAAKAMSWLAWIVGYQQARHDEGLSTARYSEAMLSVAGGNDLLKSRISKTMGLLFWKKAEYDKALDSLRKSLKFYKSVFGAEHLEVANSLNNIGLVFQELGEYEKALEFYRKVQPIDEKTLGTEHPDVAFTINNIGQVLSLQGEHTQALKYFHRSLAIWEKSLGSKHPDVARSLNSIGFAYRMLGAYDKALERHRRALAIREETLGPEHPLVAYILNNIGAVFTAQGHHKKALTYFERSLQIFEKALGSGHPMVAKTLSGISTVLINQGRPNQALKALNRSVAKCEKSKCDPEFHGNTLFSLSRVLAEKARFRQRAIKLAVQARELFGKIPKAFRRR